VSEKILTTNEKILIPAAEAAALLSMGKSTFWREVTRGTLPAPVKVGGMTRWRVSDLYRFVEALASTTVEGLEEDSQPKLSTPRGTRAET
jgi:predicted DNA-binding transcriptional regulator AlpA